LGIALDVEVGIVYGVILITSGGDIPKRPRIDEFPAPEGGLEDFTVTPASVDAP
jgi:hypothetical protein